MRIDRETSIYLQTVTRSVLQNVAIYTTTGQGGGIGIAGSSHNKLVDLTFSGGSLSISSSTGYNALPHAMEVSNEGEGNDNYLCIPMKLAYLPPRLAAIRGMVS